MIHVRTSHPDATLTLIPQPAHRAVVTWLTDRLPGARAVSRHPENACDQAETLRSRVPFRVADTAEKRPSVDIATDLYVRSCGHGPVWA